MIDRGSLVLRLAVLSAAYYVAAMAGLALLTQTNNVALVWPATPILIAYLLRQKTTEWFPALMLCWGGGILANITMATQLPPAVMLALPGADVFFDALVGAFLLRHFAKPGTLFDSLRGVTMFLLLGCIAAPAFGAVVGGGTIAVAFGASFWVEWFKWWASTAISIAIVTPALLRFSLPRSRAVLLDEARLEAIGLSAVVLGVSAVIFLNEFAGLLFLVIPVILWATLRFGVSGVSWTGTVLAAAAIAFTVAGLGPVIAMHDDLDLVQQVGFLQLFLTATYVPALVCAVVLRQRMMAEAALRQAQKLEAIGQLTGGVAHDFNNLLAVIVGNLELVLHRFEDGAHSLEEVQRALKAADRGAALTHRLLALSRQQPLMPRDLDINESVGGMESLLRRTLGEEIELKFVAGPELWHCRADPSQVESTVLNLAINARDSMSGGGSLTISTAKADLDDAYAAAQAKVEPGQYVMLAVNDTGLGMSKETLNRAFEPFFTTKTQGNGSGLGLSMVKGFVEQSGGYVNVYSEPGLGTSVKIYLPRSKGARLDLAPEPQAVDMPLGAGEIVLLVEDDDDVRDLASTLLVQLGYNVLAASSGKGALDLITSGAAVDLLLTDMVLPGGIGGRELAERSRRRIPNLAVLFVSGYTTDGINQDGRLDDGLRLLPKPFHRADFARAVREALDERAPPMALRA